MQIGLVLSGGGAKGAAHIGVLKALEEENIKVNCISGTSSGSIVAVLYSCGYTPIEIYHIFKKYCMCITDYDKLVPLKVLNTLFTGKIKLKSLAKGDNIECIINEVCSKKGKYDISQLDMPCAVPAVDIVDGEIVYFCSRKPKIRHEVTNFDDEPSYELKGKLCDIVRASTAFPGVFAPKKIKDYLLVDGGIRVNSPVTILKELRKNNEKIVVIFFEKTNGNVIPKNIIETAVKSFDIMGHEINEGEIKEADYAINIKSCDVGLLDVDKIDYMVKLGYDITKKYIKEHFLSKSYRCKVS